MTSCICAVEIDVYDSGSAATTTLRLCNAGPLRSAADSAMYMDRLLTPFKVSMEIVASNYGSPASEQAPTGTIDFAVDTAFGATWFASSKHYIGQALRIYQATSAPNRDVSDLTLYFTGRVGALSFTDTKASIDVTDARLDVDNPIVSDLYTSSDGVPDNLIGTPKPQVWGTVKNCEPVLIDSATLLYQASRVALNDLQLRVGGIAWASGSSPPGQGEYYVDLTAGTVQLGSAPLNFEVRFDARSADYATMTTAGLLTKLATDAGLSVDSTAMTALDSAFSAVVGYYTQSQPLNLLNAFDDIAQAGGCYWAISPAGELTAGVIDAPAVSPDASFDQVYTNAVQVSSVLPPVWRLRVQYQRHWQPSSNFVPGLLIETQTTLSGDALVADEFSDATIKTAEPRAIDAPIIKGIVDSSTDAEAIRDRLSTAWSVVRNLYAVSVLNETTPMPVSLYNTAQVDFSFFSFSGRVHSIAMTFGEIAPIDLTLWG